MSDLWPCPDHARYHREVFQQAGLFSDELLARRLVFRA